MISKLSQQIEDIQSDADSKIEALCQKEYTRLFNELVKRYPKRQIQFYFGNGATAVAGFENTSLSDSYGLLESYSFYKTNRKHLRIDENHPLIELMKLIDCAVYPSNASGWQVCCENLSNVVPDYIERGLTDVD